MTKPGSFRDKLIDLAGIATRLEAKCIENLSQARFLKIKLDEIVTELDNEKIAKQVKREQFFKNLNSAYRNMVLPERYFDE